MSFFWMNLETGANPDTEILAALRPGMATVPGALLIGVSTPYARRGDPSHHASSLELVADSSPRPGLAAGWPIVRMR